MHGSSHSPLVALLFVAGLLLLAPLGAQETSLVKLAEEEGWQGKTSASVNVNDGNVQTTAVAVHLDAVGRFDPHRVTAKGAYYRSRAFGLDTGEHQKATLRYDYLLDERWYLLGQVWGEHDKFKGLDLRRRIGAGVGNEVIHGKDHKVRLEALLEQVHVEFDRPVAVVALASPFASVVDADDDYLALGLALVWEYRISDSATFQQHFEYTPSSEDLDEFFLRSESVLEVNLEHEWYVDLRVDLDHESPPATLRERTDTRYLVGLAYRF